EPQKLRILYAYYETEDNLEEIETLENQIKAIQTQLKILPDEINQLNQRIDKESQQTKPQRQERFSHYKNDELEQRLFIEKSNLNDLNSNISHLDAQIAEQTQRPQKIREQITELKKLRDDTYKEQLALSNQISNKHELNAHQMQFDSRLHKLYENLSLLDLENIIHPLKSKAHKLELQWLKIQEKHRSHLIDRIDEVLTKGRQKEIDKVQDELELKLKQTENKHTVIQEVAAMNLLYHQLLQVTNKKLTQYQDQKSKIKNQHEQLEKDFQSAEKKINLAGLSPALGNHLRDQHRRLPLLQNFKTTINLIQKELAITGLKIFQLDERRQSLVDIEKNIKSKMEVIVTPEMDTKEKLRIRSELRGLLSQQKDQVSKLNLIFSDYSRTLADVDFSLNQLMILGETYSNYLNERLLWVPSAPIIDKHYLSKIYKSTLWFFNHSQWQQLVIDAKHGAETKPVFTLIALLLISSLFLFRPKVKIALEELLEKSAKLYSDKFKYTFYGLAYVFFLALPFSFVMLCMGSFIFFNDQATDFSHSVAHGLLTTSVPLLLIQFIFILFKPADVVYNLFNWNKQKVQLIYRQLNWLRFIIIPGIFITGLLNENAYSKHGDSLGRISLIIIMLALLYTLHRFAHPTKGLAKDFYQIEPDSWISRLRYIWYFILLSMPLLIIGFAIAGYYQSALELEHKLIILLRLIAFSVLFHEIVMRGMVLANRQLALQNARHKRKQHEQAEANDHVISTDINSEEELILDIPKINEQNRKLLSATIVAILLGGSWLTLHDVLPALSIFNKVVFWQHMTMIDGKETL
ncbi:MAG: mechanosensitive ion channel protein MscS, partial [Methylococcales bacterium]|nr:mechanosensitive ion channel protein MscS [Methylococcales bacterium]